MEFLRRARISKTTALAIVVSLTLVWFVYATVVNHAGNGRGALWEGLLLGLVTLGAFWMARD